MTRHMERAILQIKGEIIGSGKAHSDLAELLRKQEQQLGDFLARREQARKTVSLALFFCPWRETNQGGLSQWRHEQQQQAIEKLWKQKREQIDVVGKVRALPVFSVDEVVFEG